MHRGLFGYKAYINNICVGIVFATVDKRTPAYNCCELSYYPEFFSQFGEWHRIKSNGERIRFAYLEDKIKKDRSYTFIIDK
ncbi:MAG: hypothetical protein IK048_03660 [Clostridia bacterium]|nr:hypothetical protein [Clostridia bacterium]